MTFILLPQAWKILNSKWTFKVKLNAHGDVEKYKARLVARGFSQVVGIDYMDIFSLIVKIDFIRII
jgi:putative flippase GtrA